MPDPKPIDSTDLIAGFIGAMKQYNFERKASCDLADVCDYMDVLQPWVVWVDEWVRLQIGGPDKDSPPPPPSWPPG